MLLRALCFCWRTVVREGSVINLNERMKSISIEGVGSYLPERVVTNDDLAKVVDTSDEWIRTRTGIGERHLAAEGEACSDLAVRAAQRAFIPS